MLEEINAELVTYFRNWQEVMSGTTDDVFFASQRPTAVAWKMTDRDELFSKFNELKELCDQIHFGWVNERWLVTMHLKELKLEEGIEIVKLMERRSGSTDAVGLDHVDFYSPDNETVEAVLNAENLKWSKEQNGDNCSWHSVWFENSEAKLRTDTVLSPCISELQEIEADILQAN